MNISKEDIIYLAHISRLHIHEDEIPALIKQIQDVLTYAKRVEEVAMRVQQEHINTKNCNVFKEDTVLPTNPAPLLEQAPESIEHYFVVPVIIDQK